MRRMILFVPLAIGGFAVFVAIGGFIVMSLWNALVPALFHGPALTFWQALGLLLLSRILFGNFGMSGRGSRWRRGGSSEERRERFRRWVHGESRPAPASGPREGT